VSASACQRNPFGHLTGQEDLQKQAEGIVAQNPEGHFSIEEPSDSLFGPSHFALELI
jgi:hypothetical protein